MEIITGVERRRRWRAEGKLRVLAEAAQPGARTSEVARRHDIQPWASVVLAAAAARAADGS
ncbi:transposase [Muricoccus pecuniae]|uniref:Transposase-like protein n=1 Tax=Muricoccus pecuniae TaxID=693023 RepID=A0A840Y732_9PROT|nr:transposase [Roseomonas pecuniae]MBB5695966.1 transposase-like protein [Roseomonas pecuniae]